MSLTFETLTGGALDAALDDVAGLRIEVFRAFPYLYDGDVVYERRYLESYRNNPQAILVVARDSGRIVGASTGTPLVQHDDAFAAPLVDAGYSPEEVFYCAESVLLAAYRGQGAGHTFFDAREAHARALGARYSVFCTVERADDHPARPADYRDLVPFWTKRGYAPIPGAVARFSWREVGETAQSEHRLPFWGRTL